MIWVLSLMGLLIIVGLFLYIKKSAGKTEDAQVNATIPKEDHLTGLLSLNLDIRKSAMPSELILTCEEVIDKLVRLLPAVDEYPSASGELAWSVKIIASEYLPNKCVGPYSRLMVEKQKNSVISSDFKASLLALSDELDSVSDMLSRRDEAEFNNKVKFLQQRFNTAGEA